MAITDNNGSILSPLPVAPGNETNRVLLPKDLQALKKVAKKVELDLRGASLNLDGGFDSTHNRTGMFHAGMIPNIKENLHNRKRLFNAAIHALRARVERTFAWEDTCKRLLLQFAHSALRADSGNMNPFLRDRLVGRLRHTYPV